MRERTLLLGLGLGLLCACASSRPAASAVSAPAAATPRQLLVGRWHALSVRVMFGGVEGTPPPVPSDAYAEYRADGTWSGGSGNRRNSGTYRWISDDEVEITFVDSAVESLKGVTSVRRVVVTRDRLELFVATTREKGAEPGRGPDYMIFLFERAAPR
jgi:hypothetical protein